MKMKKTSLAVMFLITSSCLFGCGEKENAPEYRGVEGTLKISIFEGGNGNTWCGKVADAYKKYNPDAKIDVYYDPLVRDDAVTACETNSSDTDIFFIDGVNVPTYVELYHSIADISELYSSKPKAGQNEENITIAEKLKPEIVEEMKYNGDQADYQNKYYTAPFSSGPCSIIMNVDALDSALGKGNWEVPNTSNELLELCNKIVAADAKVNVAGVNYTVYPFIYGDALEYWRYMYYTWIAQYDEFENWDVFTDVKINGEYNIDAYFTEGKYKGLAELEKIIKRENGYCDPTSMSNKFKTSQKYFLQGRACMYCCGDWFEREMENSTSYSSNMMMIKVPVLSEMANKIEQKFKVSLGDDATAKDEKLSAIVEAIDNKQTSYEGISEEVFNFVKETRSLTYTLGNSSYCFIPECSANKQIALDFLRFMYTDEAIQIIFEDTKSLIPTKDTSKYKINENELTQFRKSVLDIVENPDTKLVFSSNRSPIRYRAGLGDSINNEKPEIALGKKTGAMSAAEYLQKERTILEAKWSELMRNV